MPTIKKLAFYNTGVERKWLFKLITAVSLSLFIITAFSISALRSPTPIPSTVRQGAHYPPAFAYYIFGNRGDSDRMFRLLLAVYHPRNRYLLHIGSDASDSERFGLASAVRSVPAVKAYGNADVVGKSGYMTFMGATKVANALHGAAVLLKLDKGWSWLITLSALDYPLITQDDLSHVFSSVRRDLNFIDHTSDLGWKEYHRVQPIIVDPGLYLARRSQIFTATQRRPTPDAFKVFTGSPWVILSRSFLEYCVFGWDNLPRTLLMYFNNAMLSEEGYFHTVVCNSPEFKNKTINNDLRYMLWDNPPKMDPLFLNISDYNEIVQSGAAFARQFQKDDPVLDMIDEKILKRGRNRVSRGAWCTGQDTWWTDPCSQWGDVNILKPGPLAKKLEETITGLLDDWESQTSHCE